MSDSPTLLDPTLLDDAARLEPYGRIRLEWIREAEGRGDGATRPAWLRIETDRRRGEAWTVSWNLTVSCLADEVDDLNALMRVFIRHFESAGETIREVADLRDELDRALARARELRDTLAAWSRGEGFFGRVRMRWDQHRAGAVWLEDPDKGASGYGLYFATAADLWARYPQLRPVGAGEDDGGPWVDLEAFAREER